MVVQEPSMLLDVLENSINKRVSFFFERKTTVKVRISLHIFLKGVKIVLVARSLLLCQLLFRSNDAHTEQYALKIGVWRS